MDYRKNLQAPAITLADIECDQETHVADSFADYLGMLQIHVDDEYVLEAVSDIEKLKADLSLVLGVPFDPPDTGAWLPDQSAWEQKRTRNCSGSARTLCPADSSGKDDRRYSTLGRGISRLALASGSQDSPLAATFQCRSRRTGKGARCMQSVWTNCSAAPRIRGGRIETG